MKAKKIIFVNFIFKIMSRLKLLQILTAGLLFRTYKNIEILIPTF